MNPLDAWRLATGTLTAIPVRPPRTVDRRTAGLAMMLAPLAVLPLAAGVVVVLGLTAVLPLAAPVGGMLAVGLLALGSRAMHLDGLADTADGLTASYDRQRSLTVMKSGTSGPAGVTAIVIVLVLQAMGLAALVDDWSTAVVAGIAVCFSRAALAWCCSPLFTAARPDGLGRTFVGTVPAWIAGAITLVLAAILIGASSYAGLALWRPLVGVAIAVIVLGLLLQRTTHRFGGITGDVFGAAIEITLAMTLVLLGS